MSQTICPKCGENSTDAALSFCTNCGAKLKETPSEPTLVLPKFSTAENRKPKSVFPVVLLTSLLTALFVIGIFAAGLYFYFSRTTDIKTDGKTTPKSTPTKSTSTPTSRPKKPSSVAASDITKVEFRETLYGTAAKSFQAQANRIINNMSITTNYTRFSADGTAFKSTDKTEYDSTGTRLPDKKTEYSGAVSQGQFAELARVLVENDFLNEGDSKELMSDSNAYALRVFYAGGEKLITASNTGKDTPEMASILQAFRNLQNQINWKELK